MKRHEKRRNLLHKIEAGILLAIVAAIVVYTLWILNERRKMNAQTADQQQVEIKDGSFFKKDTIEFEGKTYQRNTYVKAILCMGVDRSGSLEETTTAGMGGQADGVLLVAQDTARNSLNLLMIPRDTMTEITLTDLSGNVLGEDVQHLTLAYAYGDGRETSCEFMTEAVSKLLGGLNIDYYLAANVDAVSVVNDLVGGVTVTVPTEGMEQVDPAFVYGETVTLQGKQAERFVRYRDITRDHSALYRMDQQQEYITQFFNQLREESKSNAAIVEQLFESIESNMVTNMQKDQYLKMAMDGLASGGSPQIYTLPGTGVTTGKYDEFYPDEEGLTKIILELFYREK